MPKKKNDNFEFYIGNCDFCGNTFTKVRQFNTGKWVCEQCFSDESMTALEDYKHVIDYLAKRDPYADNIAARLEAILLSFKYNYDLLSPREKRWFEKEIKEWKKGNNDNWGNEDNGKKR